MVTFSFSALSDASTRLPPVSVWSYLRGTAEVPGRHLRARRYTKRWTDPKHRNRNPKRIASAILGGVAMLVMYRRTVKS